MLRLFCKLTFWLCLARESLPAQPAAAPPSGGPAAAAGYFRLWLANDVLQGTDHYYTGGLRLEYAGPLCGNTPLRHLLVSLGRESVPLYGVTLVADAFTPTVIGTAEVQAGDRPYAGYLYAGQFLVSRLPDRRLTLTTRVHLGLMGPPAGMQRVQKGIHQWLDLERPRGWRNQVGPGLVVDYALQAAHVVQSPFRFLELTVQAGARAGTLYNYLDLGTTLRVGMPDAPGRKRQAGGLPLAGARFHAFWQSEGKWVGYNATLQGGLGSGRSRYTLRPDQVSRTVLGHTAGLVFSLGNLRIEGSQTWLSREFEGGGAHRWNTLSLGLFF